MLFEHAVNYHCRKGLRRWCYCDFCNKKREATARIGRFPGFSEEDWGYLRKSGNYFLRHPYAGYDYDPYDDIHYIARKRVRSWRQKKRVEFRRALADRKSDI